MPEAVGPFPKAGAAVSAGGQKPRLLYSVSGNFPFDFFPDTCIIDEEKLTIIYRKFLFEREIVSLYYYSLVSASVQTGIFFGMLSVELAMGLKEEQPQPIKFLGRNQAEYARKLIVGMIRLHQRKEIDFTKMSRQQIIEAALNEGTAYVD